MKNNTENVIQEQIYKKKELCQKNKDNFSERLETDCRKCKF